MPDSIVRIVCEQNTKFWTVQQGGAVRLGSESEAQLFVCHGEGDRSCFIQHLQSGAFVEQGDDRKLKLGTSPASASLFSRLKAYSEGGEDSFKDSFWLRAATGGIVCANSQLELAVTISAASDNPSWQCSYTFLTADPSSVLMKGLAPHVCLPELHTLGAQPLPDSPAPVSIGAAPFSPQFPIRSQAMPIALKRPIRKVSFSDLASLDPSMSDSNHKSVPLSSSMSRNSGSFSRSYTLKEAISNCVPTSPGYSLHSEGSETDESKVRGGHLFDSDQVSSSDSLSHLDEAFSEVQSSPSLRIDPDQQLSHSLDHQGGSSVPASDVSQVGSPDDRSCRGEKTHGGNFFKKSGGSDMRSVQSTPALGLIPSKPHGASHRVIQGQRIHGSQSAFNLHGQTRGMESPVSPQSSLTCGSRRTDNSEALASLRLSRTSGDSHREPMLPCILEGFLSQESETTLKCPPALDVLLGRNGQKTATHNGLKRICSSPEFGDSLSFLSHPAIRKVTPRGSPSLPSPSKRLHTRGGSLDTLLLARQPVLHA